MFTLPICKGMLPEHEAIEERVRALKLAAGFKDPLVIANSIKAMRLVPERDVRLVDGLNGHAYTVRKPKGGWLIHLCMWLSGFAVAFLGGHELGETDLDETEFAEPLESRERACDYFSAAWAVSAVQLLHLTDALTWPDPVSLAPRCGMRQTMMVRRLGEIGRYATATVIEHGGGALYEVRRSGPLRALPSDKELVHMVLAKRLPRTRERLVTPLTDVPHRWGVIVRL